MQSETAKARKNLRKLQKVDFEFDRDEWSYTFIHCSLCFPRVRVKYYCFDVYNIIITMIRHSDSPTDLPEVLIHWRSHRGHWGTCLPKSLLTYSK